jgi:hypothetical protein
MIFVIKIPYKILKLISHYILLFNNIYNINRNKNKKNTGLFLYLLTVITV